MEPFIIYNEAVTVTVISVLIFLSRIADVSIGTLRVIYVARGRKFIAPVLAFFEILIWLLVARQVISGLTNWNYLLSYCLGFAAGTFVGIWIEERYTDGKVLLRIMMKKGIYGFETELSENKCNYTMVDALATDVSNQIPADVKVFYMTVKKRRIGEILQMIRRYDMDAHYSIEDVRDAFDDFPEYARKGRFSLLRFRKSK